MLTQKSLFHFKKSFKFLITVVNLTMVFVSIVRKTGRSHVCRAAKCYQSKVCPYIPCQDVDGFLPAGFCISCAHLHAFIDLTVQQKMGCASLAGARFENMKFIGIVHRRAQMTGNYPAKAANSISK